MDIKAFIDNYNTNSYNIFSNNCTTFAVDALKAGGVEAPTKSCKWQLPEDDLKALEDENSLLSQLAGSWREVFLGVDKEKCRGYSPADTVEDFKKNENVILYDDIKYEGIYY